MRLSVDASMIRVGHGGGVEMFTYGLLTGIADVREEPVRVNVLRGSLSQWQERVPAQNIAWSESAVPLRTDNRPGQWARRWIPTTLRDSRGVRGLVTAVRQPARARHSQADVVLMPTGSGSLPPRPTVVVMHDFRPFQDSFSAPGFADRQRRNIRSAAAVVVTWPHPYQEALRRFPEAADRIVMIPSPPLQLPQQRTRRAPEPGLLVYPSSTAQHKNHATLLEAMALLPECRLICPGPLVEPQASRLIARSARPDLAGRVSFPGFVTSAELDELYARADAVVVPSLWEAASGAMLEAFDRGIPVACADSAPLLAQLEFTGGDAAVFTGRDPHSLADAVGRLQADRERFAAAASRAGRRLGERTWQSTGRDYLEVLNWVTDGQPGPIPRSEFGRALLPRT